SREAYGTQSSADLSGTAGVEVAGHRGGRPKALDDPIASDRRAPVRAHRHACALGAVPADGLGHRAPGGHHPGAQRQILAPDPARGHRGGEGGVRFGRARHDQEATRTLVEPVHEARARQQGELRIERQKRVLQRMPSVARAGLHHQSRRLVDDDDRRIQAQSGGVRGQAQRMRADLRRRRRGRKCGIRYTRRTQAARSQSKGPLQMLLRGSVRGSVIALCIVVLAVAGCRTHREREERKPTPDLLYKRARHDLDSNDFNAAIKIYEQLTARYPFSDEARQSRLDLIYAYYRAGEGESATDAAETF